MNVDLETSKEHQAQQAEIAEELNPPEVCYVDIEEPQRYAGENFRYCTGKADLKRKYGGAHKDKGDNERLIHL